MLTRPTVARIPARVITVGLLLTAMLVVAQAASQWIDFRAFDLRLRVLDSDHHASVFGALSILAQAAAAGGIGLRAISTRRPAWLLLAALVGLVTIPRTLMSYEVSLERYELPILAVLLTVVVVAVCALTFHDPRRVRSMVWASLALLGCSYALHVVGPQAHVAPGLNPVDYTAAFQLTGMLKHGAELAGWILLATAMTAGSLGSAEHNRRTVNEIAALLKLRRRTVRELI
jgi:hypothetical protein